MKSKSEKIRVVVLMTTAILAIFLFSAVSVSAQPVEVWNVTWGGTGGDRGYATATGGSVYLAGSTESFGAGSYDAFLNKYNSTTGDLIWNLTWGGTGGDRGYATATGDSVYLAGETESFGAGGSDAFLNKYDNDGNLIWNLTWGGTGKDFGEATATGDSVYLAGGTESFGAGLEDAFLNKYNSTTGELIWNLTWGGTGGDRGSATATGDSVYLAGSTESFGAGGSDAFLNKYNSTTGELIWNLTWGGTGWDRGYATATGDSVYLAGATSFGAGGGDAFLNKYDNDGNLIWNVTWGGTSYDQGYATATGDSVYLAGETESFGAGGSDAFLVKYSEEPTLPPKAVPAFGTIGLLALIGILSVVLAVAVVKRKK